MLNLHLARFALAVTKAQQCRQTNKHVHQTFHKGHAAKKRIYKVPIKEPDQTPVNTTDDYEHTRNLMRRTQALHHNDGSRFSQIKHTQYPNVLLFVMWTTR